MKQTILPPKVSRYYSRHRKHHLSDGTPISALMTRYAWEVGYRNAKGPRGGKALQKFYRIVYYHDGIFYKDVRFTEYADEHDFANGNGVISHVLAPITGTIWDCHKLQSEEQNITPVKIECVAGVPITVTTDDLTIWDASEPWQPVAAFLGLDKAARKSPKTISEPIFA